MRLSWLENAYAYSRPFFQQTILTCKVHQIDVTLVCRQGSVLVLCTQGTSLCVPHLYLYLYLRGRQLKLPSAEACIFGSMRNPNMTKGQENLLVALVNRRRVVVLTLPNSSGSRVCALIMECLDTI